MPDAVTRPRAWLSAAESRLVASSRGEALKAASPAELRRTIARARALRDKWRDVHASQRRGTQQALRGRGSAAANVRSREKRELFAKVLQRLEARLARVEASPGRGAGGGARPAGTPKATRARTHRRGRAQAKRKLAAKVAGRASAQTRAAQARRPPLQTRLVLPPASREAGAATASGAARKATKTAKAKAGKKKVAARGWTTTARAADQSATASTRYRMAVSGRTTRGQAHVAARGRRQQARRDRRGR